MKTRNQTKQENNQLYNVNIDFDDASAAWKLNKKSIGNGCYKYICIKCGNSCYNVLSYCWRHRNNSK